MHGRAAFDEDGKLPFIGQPLEERAQRHPPGRVALEAPDPDTAADQGVAQAAILRNRRDQERNTRGRLDKPRARWHAEV